jgi:N-acetylmuramoyl-L-alanine amidase
MLPLLALLCSFAFPMAPPRPDPSAALFPKPLHLQHIHRLVLDPGHGGENLGALGAAGVREKALTLEIAKHVAEFIRLHSDAEVVLTREKDVALDLRSRPRKANELKGDAFISIHTNAHELGEATGMEVFFLAADASAETVRQLIEREEGIDPGLPTAALPWSVGAIVNEMGHAAALDHSQAWAVDLADGLQKLRPHARFRGVRQAPFGVLKEALMPAVVLEVGYITQLAEARTLLEERTHTQFAAAILLAMQALDRQIALEDAGRKPVTTAVKAKR